MPSHQQIFGHNAVFSDVTLRSVMLEFSNMVYLTLIFCLYVYVSSFLLSRYSQILVFSSTFWVPTFGRESEF